MKNTMGVAEMKGVREIERKCKTVEEAVEELKKVYGDFEFVKVNYAGDRIYYNEKLGFVAVTKTACGVDIDVLGC